MSDAHAVLHKAEHVLLDFDGPVCGVFAHVTDSEVADAVRAGLTERGRALPETLRTARDPFDMLAYAADIGPEIATAVEEEFTRWEQHAVRQAPATPGVREVLAWISDSGRSLTIVSNNAVSAIETYLEHAGLRSLVGDISARQPDTINQLKPHPHLLERAITNLTTTPERCVMIGDSTTDIEAAATIGVPSIAFANKPGKADKLVRCKPRAVITSMSELLPASARTEVTP